MIFHWYFIHSYWISIHQVFVWVSTFWLELRDDKCNFLWIKHIEICCSFFDLQIHRISWCKSKKLKLTELSTSYIYIYIIIQISQKHQTETENEPVCFLMLSWYVTYLGMWHVNQLQLGFGNLLRSYSFLGTKSALPFCHNFSWHRRVLPLPGCEAYISSTSLRRCRQSAASNVPGVFQPGAIRSLPSFGQRPPQKHEKGWSSLMDGVRSRRPHAVSTTPMTLEQRSGNFPKVHQINKRSCELKTNDPSGMGIGHNNWVLVLQCGSMVLNGIHS